MPDRWISVSCALGLLAPGLAMAVPGATWERHAEHDLVVHGRWETRQDDPVIAAERFLAGPGQELAGNARLELLDVRESPLGFHVLFQQLAGGLPVHDGLAGVTVEPGGTVLAAWSTVHPAKGGTVRLRADEAIDLARRVLAGPVQSLTPPSAVLGAGPQGATYRVTVPSLEPAGVWQLDIDAANGRLVGPIEDVARYRDGIGQVFHVNASVALQSNALRDQNDSDAAVPVEAYETVDLLELDASGYLVGPYADLKSSVPRRWRAYSTSGEFIYTRNANEFEAVQAYWGLDYAQRYIQSLGFDDVNNRQLKVSVDTYPSDNSFYSAGSITYGAGGVDDAEDTEVVWHEMGHAIQDDQIPGFGASEEAGSMGEGFGDYIAASIGSLLSGGWQDECVAEWDATSYSTTNPPCLRRTDGDKVYPRDMEGEVHADGEIWSAALWDCRAIVGNDRGVSYVIASHFLLSPSATFEEGALAYLDAAQAMGATPDELTELEAAFVARGIL